MYKFRNNQIKFSDFGQSVGLHMNPENRWIKKAEMIPWAKIEQRYAKLFTNKKGNVAKPLRLALGACIIQTEYGYSDEETVLMIREYPYLQFFCGFSEFVDARAFDPSLMVYLRKRLTPEILGEINEMIIQKEQQKKDKDDNDKPEPPQNNGTLIVDVTCAPSQIKYPQDTELLNEARENTEEIISKLHNPDDGKKHRTYKKRAHKDYMRIARKKKKKAKEIRKAIGKQLCYLKRKIGIIDNMEIEGKTLSAKWAKRLDTIKLLYDQ